MLVATCSIWKEISQSSSAFSLHLSYRMSDRCAKKKIAARTSLHGATEHGNSKRVMLTGPAWLQPRADCRSDRTDHAR
jgi:hypothetical protein